MNSIVTVGMFDGVHVGHRHLLKLLREKAQELELLPVVVTFDRHPRMVLGKDTEGFRLLSTTEERERMLRECGAERVETVEFTKELAAKSACEFVKEVLMPRMGMQALVVGYDNSFGNKSRNDFDRLPQLGKELEFKIFEDSAVILDGMEVSSTKIRNALAEGNLTLANKMLGASYSLTGRVMHGRGVGHTLGFPTANISVEDKCKALPKEGVYAVKATILPELDTENAERRTFPGMANLGPQPTFGLEKATFEVNLFGCEEDLYGKELRIELNQFLRETRKFETSEALEEQLEKDKRAALSQP